MHKPVAPPADSSSARLPLARRMGSVEVVLFVAASLVIGAMATDLFLPALGEIGQQLMPRDPAAGQVAIGAFLIGMGCAQLTGGPAADHFGGRAVAVAGAAVFALGGALAAQSADLTMLTLARMLQGVGAGTLRVAAMCILRDRHHGPSLARVTSQAMSLLLLEPILGPLLGQALLFMGGWRMAPMLLALGGAALAAWALQRAPEPRSALAASRGFDLMRALGAYRAVFANRAALRCMVAYALVMGAHIGFLTAAQAIFRQAFGEVARFAALLALVSIAMAVAAMISASLASRYRSQSLVLAALAGLVVVNGVALAAQRAGWVDIGAFMLLQGASMFAFGMLAPNLTALAMNDFSTNAGTAAAVLGFLGTVPAALLGLVIARLCDGSVERLFAAYLVLGTLALYAFGGTLQREGRRRPSKA